VRERFEMVLCAAELGVSKPAAQAFRAACDVALPGPTLSELLAPLVLALPAQVTIERLARRLGLDPDAPRGLKKVTQTD
jgi:glucosamine--fructose-6-phosphate aminotransferase (isomerizing)